jgi:hypothetical protein
LNAFAGADESRSLATTYNMARRDLQDEIARGVGYNTGRLAKNKEALALLDKWQAAGVRPVRGGKMYEVAIKADPAHFLDWDAPLSAQSEPVRQKLQQLGVEPKPVVKWQAHQLTQADIDAGLVPKNYAPGSWISAVRDPAGRVEWHGGQVFSSENAAAENAAARSAIDQRAVRDKGAELYRDLGSPTKGEATQRLREVGIPGIKYYDQGSRMTAGVNKLGDQWFVKGSMTPYPSEAAARQALEASGQGTRNYVVFDDKLIEIVKKYGIAATLSAGLINESQARQLEQRQGQLEALKP